ncbi:MAG: hypothetical protein FWD39_06830, partial [Clostridiales bacterium]|nr:hypothetical protein [Clostridiales bacterium]
MRGLGWQKLNIRSSGARLAATIVLTLLFVAGFSFGFNSLAFGHFWKLGGLEHKKSMVVSALPLYGASGQEETDGFLSGLFGPRSVFSFSGGMLSSFMPSLALA